MVSINDNSSTEQEQNNLNIYDILNLEPLSALDKFNLAIVKSNSILDDNILPLSVAALTMENENATIDEIAMWLAAKQKDKKDHPEYEDNLIETRKLLKLI
jgi:hypothetical protein